MKLFRCCLIIALGLCSMQLSPARAQEALLPHERAELLLPADRPLEVMFCLDVSGSMISQHGHAVRHIMDKLHQWMAKRPVRAGLIMYYDSSQYQFFDMGTGDSVVAEALKLARHDIWGSENTGQYISFAASPRVSWTPGLSSVIGIEKRIVVVGNEAMQDDYRQAARTLREAGWHVDAAEGYSRANWSVILKNGLNHWQDLALWGGGKYESFSAFQIPPRRGTPAPDLTPFDAEIRAFNVQYNQTLQPYGIKGSERARELELQESQFDETGALFGWIARKVNMSFPEWEFIDAWQRQTIKIDQTPDALLPAAFRGLKGVPLQDALNKNLVLRRRIGGILRALVLQRQSFLAAARNTQINEARRRFIQQLAAATPTNPTGAINNPNLPNAPRVIGGQNPNPFALENLLPSAVEFGGLNVATQFGQGAPLDLSKPADTVGVRGGSGIPIVNAIPDLNRASKPAKTIVRDEGLNDEFAKISTLSRWQRGEKPSADGVEIDALQGELLLRNGEIFKTSAGDFAATIRVRVADALDAPDFLFTLRAPAKEMGKIADSPSFGWQLNAKTQKWRALTPDAAGEIDSIATDAAKYATLRIARAGRTVLLLAQEDKQWKLLRRFEVAPETLSEEVEISLGARSQNAPVEAAKTELFGALDARENALPRVDWIHFRKIWPDDLPIGKKEISDAQWLETTGAKLD